MSQPEQRSPRATARVTDYNVFAGGRAPPSSNSIPQFNGAGPSVYDPIEGERPPRLPSNPTPQFIGAGPSGCVLAGERPPRLPSNPTPQFIGAGPSGYDPIEGGWPPRLPSNPAP
jgi:hypothetical protein